MYRFRKGKVVEASLVGAVGVLAATVAGACIPDSNLRPFFELTRNQTIGVDRRLRFHRVGPAGLAAALPARLSVELPQDRHDRALGRRRAHRQPDVPGAGDQPRLRSEGGPVLRRTDFPVRLHLHHVWRNLGLPRAGVVGDDAEDGRQGERHPDDRLRRDADGGPGRGRRADRRGVPAELDVLRHQHRPGQPPRVRPSRWRRWRSTTMARPPSRTSWSRWRRTSRSRSTAGPAAR